MLRSRHLVIVLLAMATGILLLMVSTSAFNRYSSVTENTPSASIEV
jgi:hypothetical protein